MRGTIISLLTKAAIYFAQHPDQVIDIIQAIKSAKDESKPKPDAEPKAE